MFIVLRLPRILLYMPLSFYGRAALRYFAFMTGWRNPADNIKNQAPSKPLEEITGRQCVHILYPTAQLGDVSTYELYALNSLVKAFKPRTIFEIGTLHGRTTVNLLDNAENLETLFTLDIMEELPANLFARHHQSYKVKRIVCDSRQVDITPYKSKVDLIFIDADHTYEAVVSDSRKAVEMLRSTGLLVWHDYTVVGDTKGACHEFMRMHAGRQFVHIVDTTLLVMLPEADHSTSH